MPAHLTLDGASGALFCAAPLLVPDEPPGVKRLLVGVFELLVTANTQTVPGGERA
jgi:hypothetical protein